MKGLSGGGLADAAMDTAASVLQLRTQYFPELSSRQIDHSLVGRRALPTTRLWLIHPSDLDIEVAPSLACWATRTTNNRTVTESPDVPSHCAEDTASRKNLPRA